MADIPSFFNKPDFVGALLPGYIAIFVTILLAFPHILPLEKDKGLPFDFFYAVFLVAGPAVGYIIRQLHSYVYVIISLRNRKERIEAIEQYYALRLAASDAEKLELDMTEAVYDFIISTALVLLTTGIYSSYSSGISFNWSSVPVLALSAVLFLGGYLEKIETYVPLYTKLIHKHNIV